MKKYIIYKHTNKINGKIYIGKTCQDPEIRFGSNGIGYRFCPLFWNAIQKYGWNNFDHEILFENLSEEEANKKEVECIKEYDSCNPNVGYNIREGGNGFSSEKSRELWNDPEYANHIKNCMINKWKDENFKNTMCEKMKNAWMDENKRKNRSELTKKRWSNKEFYDKARKSVLEACKRSVQCVETGEIFDSITSVLEKYNVVTSNISRACKTGYKCSGFHWKYIDNNTVNA